MTINNACNLACPHCYLQYAAGGRDLMAWSDVCHILKSSFRHLCVVGKEPLADSRTAAFTSRLIRAVFDTGRSISLITNGLNLHLLDAEAIRRVAWIDVSLDGDSLTYSAYRGGSYSKLVRGIHRARASGLQDLRILQTVSSGNLDATEGALRAALSFEPRYVVVSPFQATRLEGSQKVAMVRPSELLRVLRDAQAQADGRIWLTLDRGYTTHFGDDNAVSQLRELFQDRLVYVDSDPINRGIIRVTHDGLVLSPFESIHTAEYALHGRALRQRSLSDWYQSILADASSAEHALA